MNGSTTMEFCLAAAVAPDSRKRSASMERMPVARFSSSGVSSSRRALRGHLRDGVAGHAHRVQLQRLHDGAQPLAHVGGGGEARRGLLLQAAQDDGFQLDRQVGDDLAQVGRIGELDGADGLELRRVGAVEGMPSAGQLVKNQAQGEYIGLD